MIRLPAKSLFQFGRVEQEAVGGLFFIRAEDDQVNTFVFILTGRKGSENAVRVFTLIAGCMERNTSCSPTEIRGISSITRIWIRCGACIDIGFITNNHLQFPINYTNNRYVFFMYIFL